MRTRRREGWRLRNLLSSSIILGSNSSPTKRKAGEALANDKAKRGRPSSTTNVHSSLMHNTCRGGGRPVSASKSTNYEETKDNTDWDIDHQLVDDVACAVTSSASNAAKERVHSIMRRRASLEVQPNIQDAIRERSNCFDKQFESSRLKLDELKCKLFCPRCNALLSA